MAFMITSHLSIVELDIGLECHLKLANMVSKQYTLMQLSLKLSNTSCSSGVSQVWIITIFRFSSKFSREGASTLVKDCKNVLKNSLGRYFSYIFIKGEQKNWLFITEVWFIIIRRGASHLHHVHSHSHVSCSCLLALYTVESASILTEYLVLTPVHVPIFLHSWGSICLPYEDL